MIKETSIEIIQKCLNRCVHCSSCSTEQSPLALKLEDIASLIVGLKKLGVERVCLSGGEPLLHPDIIRIVETAKGKGITTDIYTSGIVGEVDRPKHLTLSFLTALKKAGVNALLFNVQSVSEQKYNQITQSERHFPLVCKSISNAKKCGIRTEIHFVPMKQNIADAVEVIQFAEKAGVEQVNFLKLVPHGRALKNIKSIQPSEEEIFNLQVELRRLKSQGKCIRLGLPLSERESSPPCHAVREKLYIKYDGSVFGCEAFKYLFFRDKSGAETPPDTIFQNDIESIYQNSDYLKRSLELVDFFENRDLGCENCPVQKYFKKQGNE